MLNLNICTYRGTVYLRKGTICELCIGSVALNRVCIFICKVLKLPYQVGAFIFSTLQTRIMRHEASSGFFKVMYLISVRENMNPRSRVCALSHYTILEEMKVSNMFLILTKVRGIAVLYICVTPCTFRSTFTCTLSFVTDKCE